LWRRHPSRRCRRMPRRRRKRRSFRSGETRLNNGGIDCVRQAASDLHAYEYRP
jgi:hypothetical protein